jgi:hypothetical protein
MFNLVELASDEEPQEAPCKHGSIVPGHACYCHSNSPHTPRKCHIWRSYGVSDLTKWKHSKDWGSGCPYFNDNPRFTKLNKQAE